MLVFKVGAWNPNDCSIYEISALLTLLMESVGLDDLRRSCGYSVIYDLKVCKYNLFNYLLASLSFSLNSGVAMLACPYLFPIFIIFWFVFSQNRFTFKLNIRLA